MGAPVKVTPPGPPPNTGMLGVPVAKQKKPKRGQPLPPPDTRKRAELGPDLVCAQVLPFLFPATAYPAEGSERLVLAHYALLEQCAPLTAVSALWLQRLMQLDLWRLVALPEFHATPALCLKNWVQQLRRRRPAMPVDALVLTQHWALEDDVVAPLGPKLARLEQLHLSGASSLTDDSLLALTRDAPHLQVATLAGCTNVMDVSLQQLARACPQLVHLDLSGCATTNATCRLLGSNCPHLEVLLLPGCRFVADGGATALSALKKLRRLSFFQCEQVGSKPIAKFSALPDLVEFNVGFCRRINDQAAIAVAQGAPNLVVCNLAHGVVSDVGLDFVVRCCPNITDLDLSFNNVGPEALCDMSERLALKRLSLCGIVVTDAGHVVTSNVGLPDSCIAHVAENQPDLEFLNLRFQEYLTDASCEAVAEHCKQLAELVLFGLKRVSTPAVQALVEALPRLADVNVWRTEIAPEDLSRLLEQFPACNVHE